MQILEQAEDKENDAESATTSKQVAYSYSESFDQIFDIDYKEINY